MAKKTLPPYEPPERDNIADLSNDELAQLAEWRPDLKKQILMLKGIRSRRIRDEAQAKGILSAANPEKFIYEVLGWRPTDTAVAYKIKSPITNDQSRVLRSVVDNKRTAVPSGQGTGKTRLAAAIVLWWLNRYTPSIVVTTASSWTLVEAQLWREIHDAFIHAKIPLKGTLLQTELRISDKHYAIGLSTDESARFQGFHAPHVLVLIDESIGVKEEIRDAAEAICVSPDDRIIALANPTDPASWFARATQSPLWNVVRMSCMDHPNVVFNDPGIIPGAVTLDWINDRREEYGSEDAPLFQARVLGHFPKQGQNALISISWVERAQRPRPKLSEDITHKGKGIALGLDIAGPGSDLCCLWAIEEAYATLLWWTIHTDLMETVGKVVRTIKDLEGRVRVLCGDDTGIGGGVMSRLLELQRWEKNTLADPNVTDLGHLAACDIVKCNFASEPLDKKKFRYLKDELWWEMADSLRKETLWICSDTHLAELRLPKGNNLMTQLTSALYFTDSSGHIRVIDRRDPKSKDERIRALPTKSPDLAHSLMLARRAFRHLQVDWTEPGPKTWEEKRKRDWQDQIKKDIRAKLYPPSDDGPDFYDYS